MSKVSKHQWNLTYDNPNDAYNSFIDELNILYNECFPLKQKQHSKFNNKPWITTGLQKLKNKNKLYKKFIKSPTVKNHAKGI